VEAVFANRSDPKIVSGSENYARFLAFLAFFAVFFFFAMVFFLG
jgi:hypothetical protein